MLNSIRYRLTNAVINQPRFAMYGIGMAFALVFAALISGSGHAAAVRTF
jgi:hypothetical protein